MSLLLYSTKEIAKESGIPEEVIIRAIESAPFGEKIDGYVEDCRFMEGTDRTPWYRLTDVMYLVRKFLSDKADDARKSCEGWEKMFLDFEAFCGMHSAEKGG